MLIALSNQGFSQLPGSFFQFDQDPAWIGSLPFFLQADSPQNASIDYFYPSMLKAYTDPVTLEMRFGIDIGSQFPDAKFEINAHPPSSITHSLYTALKVYGGDIGLNAQGGSTGIQTNGGNIGLDVKGASIGIFVHDSNVNNSGYGIYQFGESNLMNYFSNKIGIGLASPVKMLDIAGDFRCTGPAQIGTSMMLTSTDSTTVPFPIFTRGTLLSFQFPNVISHQAPWYNQAYSLMTLTSNADTNQVEIFGTTKTKELKVTDSASTSTLSVKNQTTTTTFQMTNGAGWNKVMMSDGNGLASWTDMSPWLDMYWSFAANNNDLYSHGRNVGIGTSSTDSVYYNHDKLTVYTGIAPTGLLVQNVSSASLSRFGISTVLRDVNDTIAQGGGAGLDMPSGQPYDSLGGSLGNSGPLSTGIYSDVSSKTSGIGLIGISTQVSNNGSSSVPTYGIKSFINSIDSTNQEYGLYSEISGGKPHYKWAGYFKGGDVEINYGSFIIGNPTSKRFCFQTQYWNTGHSLYIFPSNNSGAWDPSYTSRGIALSDSGNLYVSGKIYAREIEVSLADYNIPDYVFDPNYKILPLNELETYVKINKHLPEIPSAEDVKANGTILGEMNVALLKKIEELTLYIIDLKKEIEKIKNDQSKIMR